MTATAAALLAAARAADARPPAATTRPGATAESVLFQCWARESSACKSAGDDDAVEACKTERAKTACTAERTAYEKELAAGLASDAIELLGASIKSVCLAERSAHQDGKLTPDEEAAIATGWREALDVRSEFMRACEKSGREARECDEKAGEAERSARAEFCPAMGK